MLVFARISRIDFHITQSRQPSANSSSSLNHLFKDFRHRLHSGLYRELAPYSFPALNGESLNQIVVAEKQTERVRHGSRVSTFHQQAIDSMANNLRSASPFGCNDRLAGGHSLHDYLSKWLRRNGRMHEDVKIDDRLCDIPFEPSELNRITQPHFVHQKMQ